MIKHNDHYLREIKIKVKYSACLQQNYHCIQISLTYFYRGVQSLQMLKDQSIYSAICIYFE